MKKIFIILLFFPYIAFTQSIDVRNFKVNEEIGKTYSKGTQFNFSFEIRGDYRYSTHGHDEIRLTVYTNSVSSANSLGTIRWNREGDYNLYFTNYTKKHWWFTSKQGYSTASGTSFYLVVQYAGLTKTYKYTYANIKVDVRNFKMLESPEKIYPKGTKVDFQFEIRGDYTMGTYGTSQITLELYKNSVSSSNKIGLSYWNRENDYDIYFPNYTGKTWWMTSLRSFSTNIGDRFYLVVRYGGKSKTLSYTYSYDPNKKANIRIVHINGLFMKDWVDYGTVPVYYDDDWAYLDVMFRNSGQGTGRIKEIDYLLSRDANASIDDLPLSYHSPYKLLKAGESYSLQMSGVIDNDWWGNVSSKYLYLIAKATLENNPSSTISSSLKIYTKNAPWKSTEPNELVHLDEKIELYPNPSKGLFTVRLGDAQYDKLQVFNSLGQIVLTKNVHGESESIIELNSTNPGVYFVEISNDNSKKRLKMVVK